MPLGSIRVLMGANAGGGPVASLATLIRAEANANRACSPLPVANSSAVCSEAAHHRLASSRPRGRQLRTSGLAAIRNRFRLSFAARWARSCAMMQANSPSVQACTTRLATTMRGRQPPITTTIGTTLSITSIVISAARKCVATGAHCALSLCVIQYDFTPRRTPSMISARQTLPEQ